MRTIHFKNGDEKRVEQWVVEDINKNILEHNPEWCGFFDKDKKLNLMINLKEINYID